MTTAVGFTGTRHGMNAAQLAKVRYVLEALNAGSGAVFHHGDCIGADWQAACLADTIGWDTVAHPGPDDQRRAWHPSDTILPPFPFLERNRHIVEATRLLIAAPDRPEDAAGRSGTWYTVRHARRRGIPVMVIE
jgi:hypothetical protein